MNLQKILCGGVCSFEECSSRSEYRYKDLFLCTECALHSAADDNMELEERIKQLEQHISELETERMKGSKDAV